MKTKQNFEFYIDSESNLITSYYSGEDKKVKKVEYKKGQETKKEHDEHIARLIVTNPEFFEVEFIGRVPKLSPEEQKRFGITSPIERPPYVPKRKYSEDNLVKIYNKGKQDALEKIAVEEFGLTVKPRTRYSKIITMILNEQEKNRRERKV